MEKNKAQNNTQSQIKNLTGTLFFALLVIFHPPILEAQSGGQSLFGNSKSKWGQKSQAKEGSRWTLQDWLAQKQKNNLMDQWLLMNSPSPFEFYLSGASNSYAFQKNLETKESYISNSGSLGAYAQSFGLTGDYENNIQENYNDVTGLLNLRILGSSLQTTSITLHVGQRTKQYLEAGQKESVRNLVGQLSLQAYFTKYFGLQGSYRHFFPADHATLGQVSGTRIESGIFIDFSALRIFGSWSDELQINQATTGLKTRYKRQGLKSGIVIFF